MDYINYSMDFFNFFVKFLENLTALTLFFDSSLITAYTPLILITFSVFIMLLASNAGAVKVNFCKPRNLKTALSSKALSVYYVL